MLLEYENHFIFMHSSYVHIDIIVYIHAGYLFKVVLSKRQDESAPQIFTAQCCWDPVSMLKQISIWTRRGLIRWRWYILDDVGFHLTRYI